MFKYNFQILTLLILFLDQCQNKIARSLLSEKIVGGQEAEIEEFPYQVSLLYEGRHTCGGAIISPRYVVTAAHCITGSYHLSIRAGSTYLDEGGVVVDVEKVDQHPYFDYWNIDYDISVLKLIKDLKFGTNINSILLSTTNTNVPPGVLCTVTGWGLLEETGPSLSDKLQYVKLPIFEHNICQNIYGSNSPVTDRMICAGYKEGGKSACNGDSGGALVCNGRLVGLVSWSYGCARPNYPGVYSSIPALRDFITESSGI